MTAPKKMKATTRRSITTTTGISTNTTTDNNNKKRDEKTDDADDDTLFFNNSSTNYSSHDIDEDDSDDDWLHQPSGILKTPPPPPPSSSVLSSSSQGTDDDDAKNSIAIINNNNKNSSEDSQNARNKTPSDGDVNSSKDKENNKLRQDITTKTSLPLSTATTTEVVAKMKTTTTRKKQGTQTDDNDNENDDAEIEPPFTDLIQLEERARGKAKQVMDELMVVYEHNILTVKTNNNNNNIHTSSSSSSSSSCSSSSSSSITNAFKWHVEFQKNSHRKKIKWAFPCFIANPDHMIGIINDDDYNNFRRTAITTDHNNNTHSSNNGNNSNTMHIVRYIGYQHGDANKVGVVSGKNLYPYDSGLTEDDPNGKNKTSRSNTNDSTMILNATKSVVTTQQYDQQQEKDEVVEEADAEVLCSSNTNEDEVRTSTMRATTAVPPWCPKLSKVYQDCIKKKPKFIRKDPNQQEYKLKIEVYVLQYFLEAFLQKEQLQQQQQQQKDQADLVVSAQRKQQQKDKDGDDYDEEEVVDTKDDDDASRTNTSPLAVSNTQLQQEPKNTQSALPLSSKTVTTAQVGATATSQAYIPDDEQVRTLRAGDVIQYDAPLQVAGKQPLRQAMILQCYPKDGLAIVTSNNDYIPRGNQVRLVKRYLREKLQDYVGSTFHETTYFHMDTSNNDKSFDHLVVPIQNQLSDMYKSAMHEIKQGMPQEEDKENDTQETTKPLGGYIAFHENNAGDAHDNKPGATTEEMTANKESRVGKKAQSTMTRSTQPPAVKETISGRKRKIHPDGSVSEKNNTNKKPSWLSDLEHQLEQVAKEKQQRRCNYEKCKVEEDAINMAIAVRHCLDEIAIANDSTIGLVIEEVSGELGESKETLWNYTQGNPNNFLSVRKLNEVTASWEKWMQGRGNSKCKTSFQETKEDAPVSSHLAANPNNKLLSNRTKPHFSMTSVKQDGLEAVASNISKDLKRIKPNRKSVLICSTKGNISEPRSVLQIEGNSSRKGTPDSSAVDTLFGGDKRRKPSWLSDLENRLEEVKKEQQQRRCNYEKCKAEEDAWLMAIDVRHWLDSLITKSSPIELLVAQASDELFENEEILWNFLRGNPNNRLSIRNLIEVTAKWKKLMEQKRHEREHGRGTISRPRQDLNVF